MSVNATVLDWGHLVDPDGEVAGNACPTDWQVVAEAAALGVVAREAAHDLQRVSAAIGVRVSTKDAFN